MAEELQKSQEEIDADLNKRVESFNGELIPLLGKYKVGLGATAFITPDGRIGARPIMFDAPEDKKPADAPAAAETAATPAAAGLEDASK